MDDHAVEVEVDGEVFRLVPTLQAAQTLSRHFGGFTGMIGVLRKVDIDDQVAIISAGAGLNVKAASDLWGRLWRSGDYQRTAGPLSDYLGILINGGKPLEPSKAGDDSQGN